MKKSIIFLTLFLLSVADYAETQAATRCQLKITGPSERTDWVAQYHACPSSAVAAYNAVWQLYFSGKQDEANRLLKNARHAHPKFVAFKKLQQQLLTLQGSTDPYTLIGQLTDQRMQIWVAQLPPPAPFNHTPPVRATMPPLPELVKDEFETTAMFHQRVSQKQAQRQDQHQQLEENYQRAVEHYNDEVRRYNKKLAQDKAERPQKIAAMQRKIMGESIAQVMGQPELKTLTYNADKQMFYARLVSAQGNFDQPVRFKVPLDAAPGVKQHAQLITPKVRFEVQNNRLIVSDIRIPYQGDECLASLTSQSYSAPVMSATLNDSLNDTLDDSRIETAYSHLDTIKPATAKVLDDAESSFFSTALSLEADPELAKLKQQQAELARKQVQAQRQLALNVERDRLKRQILKQQQALATLGGEAAANYKGLKMLVDWSFKHSHRNNSDTIIVIIGNRNYQKGVPIVSYAHNDARAIRTFAREGLNLPPENIIYEEDATKGVMEGIFKSTLPNRIHQGKTNVIIYFTGHGMVSGHNASLLPVDARPNTTAVTGYSRDALMKQVGASGAKSAIVLLDACYTGTSKEGEALIAGKPVFRAPKQAWVPTNTTLIAAARGNQIAWMDDKTGHSLMTYYLLKGLQGEADSSHDGSIDTTELGRYLDIKVNRAALQLHDQPQQPEVIGRKRTVFTL